MNKAICVYCSSSSKVAPVYFDVARELGRTIASKGYSLVYGGAKVGLMEALADAALAHNGKVVGVIAQSIYDKGLGHDALTQLHVTQDLRERKSKMEMHADAFIALPGGIGTLEETAEILTLKQLGLHQKPIVLLNVHDHFSPLLAYFDKLIADKFAREDTKTLYHVAESVSAAFDYIESYRPHAVQGKWV